MLFRSRGRWEEGLSGCFGFTRCHSASVQPNYTAPDTVFPTRAWECQLILCKARAEALQYATAQGHPEGYYLVVLVNRLEAERRMEGSCKALFDKSQAGPGSARRVSLGRGSSVQAVQVRYWGAVGNCDCGHGPLRYSGQFRDKSETSRMDKLKDVPWG